MQTKPSGQTVQRRIAKPLVGKLLSNPRGQLPVDSVLANRKLAGVAQGKFIVYILSLVYIRS